MLRALQSSSTPFWVGIFGAMIGSITPVIPIVITCIAFILVDCYTAYKLSVRVKRKYGRNEGKFKSEYARRVGSTFLEVLTVIALAHLIDTTILLDLEGGYVVKVVAGFFLFRQGWSILENISSESDNNWAKPLQKIMTNKASRHFEIDEDEFREYLKIKQDRVKRKEEGDE